MPQLSIIIPTHKRSSILKQCLQRLEEQTIADQIEVIVVSDGHDDDTASLFTRSQWRIPVEFIAIQKSQQGTARNKGVAHAKSSLVLFIGDDIFLEPQACEYHANLHQSYKLQTTNYKLAVLGFTTWDPALDITPVMRWLETSGWQFGYPMLEQHAHDLLPKHLQHRFCYTSHISLPKDIAMNVPFREDVTLYGWEDIEWGLRLQKAGIRLFYEPDAKALHHHCMTMEQSLQRMETLGRSVMTLSKLVPALDRMPRGWKLIAYHIAAMFPTIAGRHRKAFLKGLLTTYEVSSITYYA